MRVLVVTESFLPQVNGVTNSVRRTLDHLRRRGHEAQLVAPSGPEEYAGAPVRVVRHVAMPTYPDFPVGLATRGRLRRIMREFEPDVVHLASPAWLGLQATAAARSLGVPVVAAYQTDLIGFAERYPVPGAARLMRRLTRRIHESVNLTLAPSTASMAQLAGLGIAHVERWGRGVDTRQFSPARRSTALRQELGLRRGELLVGYVGRLAPEKELDLLAAARVPGTRLVVVGGGPEELHLRELLPGADFLGVRHGDDLGRIVASLDIFVHTGRKETFCQAAQEALASGVPVVAPRAGGPLDLVRHGENGFLYDPGDAADLRDHVQALVDEPWLRARLGENGFLGVQAHSWEAVIDELIGHYRDVLGVTVPDARPARTAI